MLNVFSCGIEKEILFKNIYTNVNT